ncbi:MAG: O-antigen ligase family protein [Actinomycetota bacterium]|nr:O-antigen ligase family protein [Actinomycetota bacterium]
MAVPLVFDPREGHSGARPKYLLILAGALIGAALLAGEALGRRGVPRRNHNWLGWPVVALVASAAISTAASDHRTAALSGFAGTYDGLWATVALSLLFFATVAAFRTEHVSTAFKALWFVAGTGVLAFGLVQLVDRLVSPGGWDWARPPDSPWTIGSTLGNPNHLASFVAILLPLGTVLAVLGGGRARVAIGAIGAVAVTELVITASRGGWLAAVVGMAVLGVLFRRELGRHRTAVLRVAAAAAALAVVVTVLLGPLGVIKRDVRSVLRAGPGTTVDLRLEVWASAWRVASDHPLLGVGPDVFPVVFPAYASDRFLWLFGAFTVANGAHNLFLNTLANQGVAGLLALLAVLATAAIRITRSWRRLQAGGETRLLLGGVTAALVAYLVQACFNTQPLSLSLCFWALLGLAVALCEPRDARATLAGEEER